MRDSVTTIGLFELFHSWHFLQVNFADSEDAWEIRARRCSGQFAASSNVSAEEATVSTYEAAIQALPTARMCDCYAAFLLQQVS